MMIELNLTRSYNNHGDLFSKLKRCKEVVADAEKAKELYRQEGNQEMIVFHEDLLKDWSKEQSFTFKSLLLSRFLPLKK